MRRVDPLLRRPFQRPLTVSADTPGDAVDILDAGTRPASDIVSTPVELR